MNNIDRTSPGRTLTDKQMQQFETDGFTILPGYFDQKTLQELAQAAEDVVTRFSPIQPGTPRIQVDQTRDGIRVRMVEPVVDLSETLGRLAADERITGIFQKLFGEAPVLFEDKLNYKYPRGGSRFPMHQDFSYWKDFTPRLTSAMIYIDEATVENGCLEVVPGWHKKGLLPRSEMNVGMVTDHHVPSDVLNPSLAVKVPGPPGTLILFTCMTPHRSAPNVSDQPRRVLILTYNPASDGDFYEQRYGEIRKKKP